MSKRPFVVIAVAVLLIGAGCAGQIGGNGATEAQPEEGPSLPDGFAEDGVNDTQVAMDSFKSAMEASDSFAFDFHHTLSLIDDNETVASARVSNSYDVDVANQEMQYEYAKTTDTQGQITQTNASGYLSEGTLYQQIEQAGQTQYRSSETPFNQSRVLRTETIRRAMAAFNYSQSDVSTANGTTVITYSSTEIDEEAQLAPDENISIPEGSSEFTVSEQGVIQAFSYDITRERDGRTVEERLSIEIRDVNETTVTEPEWTDDARESGNVTS